MPSLPSATVTVSSEAGALAGGTGYIAVMGCVGTNADTTPRVFGSAKALIAQHGYSPAVDYAALHIEATKKPVIFIGLPVVTAGVVGRQDASGVTGTSVISVAAGASGYLEEVDAEVRVGTGGTIGTTGIILSISMDGGRTFKSVALRTATSYTVPYLGIVISFAAGTLIAGDSYTFTTTAPMWDSAGITAARVALAKQQKATRSWLPIGDITNSTFAGYVTTAVNAYETSNKRFVLARVNVRDRLPLAEMSRVTVRMSDSPTLTFAEVGAGNDTITRSTGSFITDGFAIGDVITVAGSSLNNVTAKVAGVSALVLTLGAAVADDLAAEGPVSNCTIVGSNSLVFTTTTCTRSGGSWLNDGFAVGDSVTFALTASNNITVVITVLTATVMTFASGGAAETIGSRTATCIKGETMSAWVATMDAAFASVASQKRIDIAIGRARKLSPVTDWAFRRPIAWAASIREYTKDIHVTNWRVEDGPLDGWSLEDTAGNVVEFDQRSDSGALEAGFTCATTLGNGPNGAFIATSLTRDTEGALLSYTHNMYVANVCCTVVQAATTRFIGKTPPLNDDGTIRSDARAKLESLVNSDLEKALLHEFVPGEGMRCSSVVWRMSASDLLNVVGATVTGSADLKVNGTIVNVNTSVKVS